MHWNLIFFHFYFYSSDLMFIIIIKACILTLKDKDVTVDIKNKLDPETESN